MLAIRKVVELPYHETRRTLISGVAGESFVISLGRVWLRGEIFRHVFREENLVCMEY